LAATFQSGRLGVYGPYRDKKVVGVFVRIRIRDPSQFIDLVYNYGALTLNA
jgi:hypothetical protein